MKKPDIDLASANKYFSAECFNRAWDLIDKQDRSEADNVNMLALSMASLWHWTQRPDCTNENLSVAYWQVSRIFSLLHQPGNAQSYGELCLSVSKESSLPPYCLGYAYEALARAALLAGELDIANDNIQKARAVSEKMKDPDSKKMLLADLETIK